MVNETNAATIPAARGLGRYMRRTGVRRELAAQYVIAQYPQFAGMEQHISAGWSAERSGR